MSQPSRQGEIPEEDSLEDLVIHQQDEDWFCLTAPSHERVISQLEKLLDRQVRVGRDDLAKLKVAIREITSNAIEWGNQRDESRTIKVSCGVFCDRVELKVEDEGPGFDPDEVFDPTQDHMEGVLRRLEENKRYGGYGILMVRELMDEVTYINPGNAVVLTKYLH